MKPLRFALTIVLLSLATGAFAQNHDMPKPAAAKSDAQISFDTIKTLAGSWEGPVTVDPPQPQWDAKPLHVTMRVTSRGNALVHEITGSQYAFGSDEVRPSGHHALPG